MSHVTGGGLAANLARVLPEELTATVDRSTWSPAPVFDLVRQVGGVDQADLEMTLNCGVGMVALVAAGARRPRHRGARPARSEGVGRRRGDRAGRLRPGRRRDAGRSVRRLVTAAVEDVGVFSDRSVREQPFTG